DPILPPLAPARARARLRRSVRLALGSAVGVAFRSEIRALVTTARQSVALGLGRQRTLRGARRRQLFRVIPVEPRALGTIPALARPHVVPPSVRLGLAERQHPD